MLAEILRADADVVCLQEVQSDHFEADLITALADAGERCARDMAALTPPPPPARTK